MDKSLQFCPHCGAGVGKYRRDGEGTCPSCPGEIIYSEDHKEKELKISERLGGDSFFIDPPTGWAHGFPCVVSAEVLDDSEKLKAFVLSKGYPAKDWEWAQNHVRVWKA